MKSIRNVILNVCCERHQSLSKNFFQKTIDKSIKVWYNKYSEREVKLMRDIMKSIQLTHHDRYNYYSFWDGYAMKPKTIKAVKKYGRKSARAKMKKIIF